MKNIKDIFIVGVLVLIFVLVTKADIEATPVPTATSTPVPTTTNAPVQTATNTPAPPKNQRYAIKFEVDGGTYCAPMEVTYGYMYGDLPRTHKSGYVFQGWFLGDTRINNDTIVTETTDHTLTAQWADANTAEHIITEYDDPVGTLPQPTRDGYIFVGWFTEQGADGNGTGTQITEDTIVDWVGSIDVYARWIPIDDTKEE